MSKRTSGPSSVCNSGPGATFLTRAGMTLFEMQCQLDLCGASDLIIDLIVDQPNLKVFLEVVELAIALLEGGNGMIQVMLFNIHNNNETKITLTCWQYY